MMIKKKNLALKVMEKIIHTGGASNCVLLSLQAGGSNFTTSKRHQVMSHLPKLDRSYTHFALLHLRP